MQDGSIDKSEYDPRKGTAGYPDEYDKYSMHSIPRNQEINNGGFPLNGPGEEEARRKHGKKKKKKKNELRPNTS
jgi:hypothetical protein